MSVTELQFEQWYVDEDGKWYKHHNCDFARAIIRVYEGEHCPNYAFCGFSCPDRSYRSK